jgi:hypothetical protein
MSNRRTQSFINWKQQLYFAGTLLIYSMMSIVVFCWATILPNPSFAANTQRGVFLPPVLVQFMDLCLDHWWAVLITVFFVGCSALLFSHQIFGPIRRFEAVLLQKKGDPQQTVNCKLRRRDYFQDFAQLLEEVLNRPEQVEKLPQSLEGLE